MWFSVELPEAVIVTELQFESPMTGGGRSGTPAVATSPRAFRVDVSSDGKSWAPVAEGQGGGRTTAISFAPVRAKFVRITQTAEAKDGAVWSMQRLRLYRPAMEPAPQQK
jgi:hypothetical protein